jgi:hypothetical protein
MVEHDVRVVYNPFYFNNIKEIVGDLIDLIRSGELEPFNDFEDYAIWNRGRLLAMIHSIKDFDSEDMKRYIHFFNEDGNQVTEDYPTVLETLAKGLVIWDGWPSRQQWIDSGRGTLDYRDPKRHPERAHSARLLDGSKPFGSLDPHERPKEDRFGRWSESSGPSDLDT